MRFAFTDEQLLFRDTVREMLQNECTPEVVRAAWTNETGRAPQVWARLAEMGVTGLSVSEERGGLGMNELDAVLILEESGRVAIPEPIVETMMVGVSMLEEIGTEALKQRWLTAAVSGEATMTVGLQSEPFVVDAHQADLILLQSDDEVHALTREQAAIEPRRSVDGSRRLFSVDWTPSSATLLAKGDAASAAIAGAFERAALGTSAQLLGLAQNLIDVTVEYAKVREQFGKPIGSFQAVKHMLVNALLKLEFARPVVYRAAYSMSHGDHERAVHVSMAKAYASDAAQLASKVALQVHGAIGYSFECDLHLWMKRAWALSRSFGDAAWHRRRVGRAILD